MPRYIVTGKNEHYPQGFIVSHYGDDPEIYTDKTLAENLLDYMKSAFPENEYSVEELK